MHPLELADALLSIIPRTMRVIRAEVGVTAGDELTLAQFRILAHLSESPKSNGELAKALGTGLPVITRQIDDLVQVEWVNRSSSAEDRRRNLLRLTPEGRRVFLRIRGQLVQKVAERLEGLSIADKKRLKEGLEVLRRLNSKEGAIAPPKPHLEKHLRKASDEPLRNLN